MPGKVYQLNIPVRFEHVDAAGIVFYPRYFEMLNRVVEEWFGTCLDCNFSQLHFERRLGIPTVHIDVSFIKPSRLDDTIRFNLHVREIGNSSFVVEHEVTCGGETRLHFVQSLVFVSLDGIKSVPVPDDIRRSMTEYLARDCASRGG